jgi:long-chain fatty acid transport protein
MTRGDFFNFFRGNMKTKFNLTLLAAALTLPCVVQAGGLHYYEMGTTDMGLAAAGTAARADDPSTVYTNPAGMTRLSGNQISTGAQALYAQAEYKQDGKGVLHGDDPGNVGGFRPNANLFYSHSVSDRLKLGLGIYGNYGMELDFGKWTGSRYVEQVMLKAASVQPTAAYRLNDNWSVGGGVVMSFGYTSLQRTSTAGVKYEVDDQDWSYGVRLGLLFEPSTSTRVGLVWQSKIEHDFEMATADAGTYGPSLEKAVRPEERMLSIWQRLNPSWAVMGNVGWQGWSKFSNSGMENRSYNGPLELKDTWHFAIGTQYTLNEKTRLNLGTAYDTGMYKDQNDTTLIMPNGAVWRIGTGVQYTLSKESELGVALAYLRSESCYDQHPAVRGGYDHPQIYFASLHYTQKF